MRHLAQARNPYSRSWLWIPGSLVSFAPRNDRTSRRQFDRLELRRKNHFKQFDIVRIVQDHVLDPGWLGPATALFHQGLALPFHVGFDPALQDIDHLKVDVVEMQF